MTNCWVLAQIGKIEMKRKCIIFTRLHISCVLNIVVIKPNLHIPYMVIHHITCANEPLQSYFMSFMY